MLRSLRLAALCSLTLLGACDPSFVAAPRLPDKVLLDPCADPVLVDNPDTATDNETAGERIRVADAYVTCKRRQADLATFVKGGK